jgi:hypothetical protein
VSLGEYVGAAGQIVGQEGHHHHLCQALLNVANACDRAPSPEAESFWAKNSADSPATAACHD